MIQSAPNALSPYYMCSFEMEIPHAKFLNYIINRGNRIEKSKISFYCQGTTYHLTKSTPLLKDLEQEQAVSIDENNIVHITEQGKKLLQNHLHLLKKAIRRKPRPYKHKQTRWFKDVPTEEDFKILELLKAKTIDNSFTIKAFAEELGLTRTLVVYRIQRLKKAKLLDYEPRRTHTIKILEK